MNFFYEHAPALSLIFFFLVFLWVAFNAYRPSAKKRLQQQAYIPLLEDADHE